MILLELSAENCVGRGPLVPLSLWRSKNTVNLNIYQRCDFQLDSLKNKMLLETSSYLYRAILLTHYVLSRH